MGRPKATTEKTKNEHLRFLAYGLPPASADEGRQSYSGEGFDLHDLPLPSPDSFLDFDGVVLFAGAFERIRNLGLTGLTNEFPYPAEVDRRERECFSLLETDTPVIFLVSEIPTNVGYHPVPHTWDLFRRFMSVFQVQWAAFPSAIALGYTRAPEFNEYLKRFGSAYIRLHPTSDNPDFVTPLFGDSDAPLGVSIGRKLFVLPCTLPTTHDQVMNAALTATSAVLAYRRRMAKNMPEWAAEFQFGTEESHRKHLADLHRQVAETERSIDNYVEVKGALCFQSDPLVAVVRGLLDRFLGITLTVDDKNIEDATLRDEQSQILAVFEIKGVKGNFTRQNVNQLDSHRERLGLTAATPGILIMNTIMSATSLQEKDQVPHPDIIKKAVVDNVLMMRTLDLLRLADAVERGVVEKSKFRETLLAASGWLKVVKEQIEIVKA